MFDYRADRLKVGARVQRGNSNREGYLTHYPRVWVVARRAIDRLTQVEEEALALALEMLALEVFQMWVVGQSGYPENPDYLEICRRLQALRP